jgi:hypothetical protein
LTQIISTFLQILTKKWIWATIWSFFSQTRLVTLNQSTLPIIFFPLEKSCRQKWAKKSCSIFILGLAMELKCWARSITSTSNSIFLPFFQTLTITRTAVAKNTECIWLFPSFLFFLLFVRWSFLFVFPVSVVYYQPISLFLFYSSSQKKLIEGCIKWIFLLLQLPIFQTLGVLHFQIPKPVVRLLYICLDTIYYYLNYPYIQDDNIKIRTFF